MVKRRRDDDAGAEGITLPGFYRYARWKYGFIANTPDPRVWLHEGEKRDRLIDQDQAWSEDPLWRRRKVGPVVDILRLERHEPIIFPLRSIDTRPIHPNETPGERISWPEAADFLREMREQQVNWSELWPDGRLIPIVNDDIRTGRRGDDDWVKMTKMMGDVLEASLYIDDSPMADPPNS